MVLTGMNYRGEPDLDQNCLNWTTAGTNGRGVAGLIANGPQTWFYYEIGTCDYMHGALICMMKTQTTPLTLSPVTGKKIFITNEPVGADEAMDSICEVDKPAGTGAVVALRATTTKAPATLIDPAATYVRPDGVVVGSGADIIAANLQTGIWQQGNGKYVDSRGLWTGSINLSTVGTAVTTCSDWTSTTGTATEGSTTRSDYSWWHDFNTIDCSRSFTWAICVEK